ncbi:MAG: DUF3299 domain-containing protein [Gammaproteobacteria bacterium]
MNRIIASLLLGLCLAATGVDAAPAKPRELTWDEMMPPAGPPPSAAFPGAGIPGKSGAKDDKPAYVPMYTYNPVKELDGQFVKLPGYIVPLESDAGGMLDEFLLVPYYGACIHVPPPPPNQIVYVKLKKPFNLKSMADPYVITGVISTKPWTGDMADTDYVMSGDKVEVFEWKD